MRLTLKEETTKPAANNYLSLEHARSVLEAWKDDCNLNRLHEALG
jgi:hypothetical protein